MDDRVHALINKAKNTEKSDDALKFSQAALNAANALRVLADMPKKGEG